MKDNVKVNKKIKLIILIIISICLIMLSIYFATAKYSNRISGIATIVTGKPILEIEVQPYEATGEIINPYCIVTVKNYNSDNEITRSSDKL